MTPRWRRSATAVCATAPNLLGYGGDKVTLWISPSEPVPPDPNSGLHFCFIARTETPCRRFTPRVSAGGRDNGGARDPARIQPRLLRRFRDRSRRLPHRSLLPFRRR